MNGILFNRKIIYSFILGASVYCTANISGMDEPITDGMSCLTITTARGKDNAAFYLCHENRYLDLTPSKTWWPSTSIYQQLLNNKKCTIEIIDQTSILLSVQDGRKYKIVDENTNCIDGFPCPYIAESLLKINLSSTIPNHLIVELVLQNNNGHGSSRNYFSVDSIINRQREQEKEAVFYRLTKTSFGRETYEINGSALGCRVEELSPMSFLPCTLRCFAEEFSNIYFVRKFDNGSFKFESLAIKPLGVDFIAKIQYILNGSHNRLIVKVNGDYYQIMDIMVDTKEESDESFNDQENDTQNNQTKGFKEQNGSNVQNKSDVQDGKKQGPQFTRFQNIGGAIITLVATVILLCWKHPNVHVYYVKPILRFLFNVSSI